MHGSTIIMNLCNYFIFPFSFDFRRDTFGKLYEFCFQTIKLVMDLLVFKWKSAIYQLTIWHSECMEIRTPDPDIEYVIFRSAPRDITIKNYVFLFQIQVVRQNYEKNSSTVKPILKYT